MPLDITDSLDTEQILSRMTEKDARQKMLDMLENVEHELEQASSPNLREKLFYRKQQILEWIYNHPDPPEEVDVSQNFRNMLETMRDVLGPTGVEYIMAKFDARYGDSVAKENAKKLLNGEEFETSRKKYIEKRMRQVMGL